MKSVFNFAPQSFITYFRGVRRNISLIIIYRTWFNPFRVRNFDITRQLGNCKAKRIKGTKIRIFHEWLPDGGYVLVFNGKMWVHEDPELAMQGVYFGNIKVWYYVTALTDK